MNSIIILGLPGSGKSTMGKYLSNIHKCQHISLGEIYRNFKFENDERNNINDNLSQYLVSRLMEKVSPEENMVIIDGIQPDQLNLIHHIYPISKIIKMVYNPNDESELNDIIKRMEERNREDDSNIKDRIFRHYNRMIKKEKVLQRFKSFKRIEYKEVSSFVSYPHKN